MSAALDPTIRFRRAWHGRQPGQIVRTLGYGIAVELVRLGIAEWHGQPQRGETMPQGGETPERDAPQRKRSKKKQEEPQPAGV
jgi:hypothetical protein